MLLLDGLADYLEAEGYGNVFVGRLPAVDESISLYSRGGPESDSKLPYDMRSVQVFVRGRNSQEVIERSEDVYATLHGIGELTLPNGIYLLLCVGIQGGPVYIGVDESNREEYSLNFRIEALNPERVA